MKSVPFNRTMRDTGCPCAKCTTKREVGCHGRCEEYKQWRAELDRKNHEEYLRRKSKDTMSEAAKKKMFRHQRRNQWRNHHSDHEW